MWVDQSIAPSLVCVFVFLSSWREIERGGGGRREISCRGRFQLFLSERLSNSLHFSQRKPKNFPLLSFLLPYPFLFHFDRRPSRSPSPLQPTGKTHKKTIPSMRSGAMLGGGGRRLTAPSSSSSSSSVVNAALPLSAPSPHAPAGRGFAPPRASASRSARVVAAAGHASSVGAALRARGSSLPAALLRAGRGAPATTSSAPRRRSSPPSSLVVRAVFERFTERAIKAVMLSQTEAKTLGSSDVRSVLCLGWLEGGARHESILISELRAPNDEGRQQQSGKPSESEGFSPVPEKNASPTVVFCPPRSARPSSTRSGVESDSSGYD